METIVIGKPAISIYLPLQEYPAEGDLFLIKNKNESLGNVAATSACTLGKWGVACHFTGVVGNDGYAEKVREAFKTYKVDTKYMETDYLHGTAVNFNTLNTKTGVVTKVLYNDPESVLTKYKYDFVPGFAIIDGTDFAGAHALLNNNGSCKTVFYGRTGDKDTVAMSKRCTWSIVTERFATQLTKEPVDGSAEGYVNMYQKMVDLTTISNYIVILNNHKILYSVEGKVKLLPEMKINIVDSSSFDSVFVGAIAFALGKELSLDDAIKFANTAAGLSLQKIGEVDSIPELSEVVDNSGLRERFGSNYSVKKEEVGSTASQASTQQVENTQTPVAMPAPSMPTTENSVAFASQPVESAPIQTTQLNQTPIANTDVPLMGVPTNTQSPQLPNEGNNV